MTTEEIKTILDNHGSWLRGEPNGCRAYLRGAYLRGADLRGAYLRGAYLRGADLRGAYLRGANLRDVDLRQADLLGAYLRQADLSDANLRGANLRGADLLGAYLRGANLRDVDLRQADLSDADLRGAYLRGAEIPVVEHLDKKILAAIDMLPGSLDMTSWHKCETTHCRAGWAITIAGKNGAALEEKIGPCAAGALIYHASTGKIPDFYVDNEEALADIRKCAGVADAH